MINKRSYSKQSFQKTDSSQREGNGSREAQMVWTICVGFAVVVSALFQTQSSQKIISPSRMPPADVLMMGGAEPPVNEAESLPSLKKVKAGLPQNIPFLNPIRQTASSSGRE